MIDVWEKNYCVDIYVILFYCLNIFVFFFFNDLFFNDTATTEIYTLSLHDALPILVGLSVGLCVSTLNDFESEAELPARSLHDDEDRKSTRLNSSHEWISYAVF